ncbi:hypothetical protein J2X65_004605 [Ancylobacter sp. 3268]|uniref:hypothetical protein n=1 Tax=Ancylobacter sp. 3268 TaxID=2817752 RepID=UPI00286086CD|nr:hypothetical protein [Ancylobacter sp. 3268]MDR6955226.1 hypothetical protein [Ancylobacter sp. 3268]
MFHKLFGAGAKPAADDLRAAISQIDMNALQRTLADAEAAYREVLLTGTDAEAAAAEAARDTARREIERAHVRRDELERRLSDAEVAERKAAAEKRVAEVVARRDELVKRLHRDIAKAHAILAPLVADLEALHAELVPMNRAIGTGDDPELAAAAGGYIIDPEKIIWGNYFFAPDAFISASQLIALPPSRNSEPLGWLSKSERLSPPVLGG